MGNNPIYDCARKDRMEIATFLLENGCAFCCVLFVLLCVLLLYLLFLVCCFVGVCRLTVFIHKTTQTHTEGAQTQNTTTRPLSTLRARTGTQTCVVCCCNTKQTQNTRAERRITRVFGRRKTKDIRTSPIYLHRCVLGVLFVFVLFSFCRCWFGCLYLFLCFLLVLLFCCVVWT